MPIANVIHVLPAIGKTHIYFPTRTDAVPYLFMQNVCRTNGDGAYFPCIIAEKQKKQTPFVCSAVLFRERRRGHMFTFPFSYYEILA